jgi:hypothetical protein
MSDSITTILGVHLSSLIHKAVPVGTIRTAKAGGGPRCSLSGGPRRCSWCRNKSLRFWRDKRPVLFGRPGVRGREDPSESWRTAEVDDAAWINLNIAKRFTENSGARASVLLRYRC